MSTYGLASVMAALLLIAVVDEVLPQDTQWVDAKELAIEGQGWSDGLAAPYDRFPAKAEGVVPDAVWYLSRNSAGVAVRFVTDATSVACRWKLRSGNLAMPHMPATGMSGVDLYIRMPEERQKPPGQQWHWVGAGRPAAQENEIRLAGGIPEGEDEFLLYLPLYNGVNSVEVGVPAEATIAPGPERLGNRARPIVIYGTSITQGGCASRPGMAYPAILGRMLDWPTINLGFSGNGRMDAPVVDLMAEIDAAAYVIDTLPNMDPASVTERTGLLVARLREAHPDTPIVLVENIEYQASAVLPAPKRGYMAKNEALKAEYGKLREAGVTGLTYVEGDELFGNDGEATVDGTHATDLGFLRMAEGLVHIMRDVLMPVH